MREIRKEGGEGIGREIIVVYIERKRETKLEQGCYEGGTERETNRERKREKEEKVCVSE